MDAIEDRVSPVPENVKYVPSNITLNGPRLYFRWADKSSAEPRVCFRECTAPSECEPCRV